MTHAMTGPSAASSSSLHGPDTQTANATHAIVSVDAITKRMVGRSPEAGAARRVRPPSGAASVSRCVVQAYERARRRDSPERVWVSVGRMRVAGVRVGAPYVRLLAQIVDDAGFHDTAQTLAEAIELQAHEAPLTLEDHEEILTA